MMYPIVKIKQDLKANVVDLKRPPSPTMMHIKNDTTKYESVKKKLEKLSHPARSLYQWVVTVRSSDHRHQLSMCYGVS